MINLTYNYQKPHFTYTLDQFIACQSDTYICYHNLSFCDIRNGMKFDTYNVISDYIDELRTEYIRTVRLNDEQYAKYKFRPKLLCFDIYGNGELAYLLMLINDMCSVKDFTKNTLLMPTKDMMNELCKYIYNANKSAIDMYARYAQESTSE